MITLYGFPSSRSLRVAWTLEELEAPWQFQYVDFYKGEHKSAEFLAINPSGKVPAIKDEELIMTESAAICQYLGETFQKVKLLPPPGTHQSGLYHQWMSFIVCELEQPLWTMGKHKFALPEEHRRRDILATAQWEFAQACKVVEAWLVDDSFVLGEQFTIADIFLTQTLNWAKKFKQEIPQKLEAYRKRLNARPALQRAIDKEVAPE